MLYPISKFIFLLNIKVFFGKNVIKEYLIKMKYFHIVKKFMTTFQLFKFISF
jgi:hypothetical protein